MHAHKNALNNNSIYNLLLCLQFTTVPFLLKAKFNVINKWHTYMILKTYTPVSTQKTTSEMLAKKYLNIYIIDHKIHIWFSKDDLVKTERFSVPA